MKDGDHNVYHRDFPKISSNFYKRTPPSIIFNQNASFPKPNENNTAKTKSNSKQEQVPEPPPYVVGKTLATRLRKIHETKNHNIVLTTKF